MSGQYLFRRGQIFSVIQARKDEVQKEVQAVPSNTLLNASGHDLIEALVEKLHLDVLTIDDDGIYIALSHEAQVDVSGDFMRGFMGRSQPYYIVGTETVIAVPFKGDPNFFQIQPQTSSLSLPPIEMGQGELLLRYMKANQDGEEIRREYQNTVRIVKEHLQSLSESAAQFNNQLENQIRSELKKRKERLLKDAGMTASIGLPMEKRAGVPTTYPIPVTRRTPRMEKIKVTGAFKPEPALAQEDYDEILRIMSNMVQVMELSPHAFLEMGEENLRTHFLVQLNGAFNGQATGETFNFQGKTEYSDTRGGKERPHC